MPSLGAVVLVDFAEPESTWKDAIVAAAREVHTHISARIPEACKEALAIEFALRGIPFVKDAKLPLFYDGEYIGAVQPIDFVCYGDVLVQVRDDAVMQPPLGKLLQHSRRAHGVAVDFGSETLQYKVVGYAPGIRS